MHSVLDGVMCDPLGDHWARQVYRRTKSPEGGAAAGNWGSPFIALRPSPPSLRVLNSEPSTSFWSLPTQAPNYLPTFCQIPTFAPLQLDGHWAWPPVRGSPQRTFLPPMYHSEKFWHSEFQVQTLEKLPEYESLNVKKDLLIFFILLRQLGPGPFCQVYDWGNPNILASWIARRVDFGTFCLCRKCLTLTHCLLICTTPKEAKRNVTDKVCQMTF